MQCAILHTVHHFTHNLHYFAMRQFVSQIYAVLSRGIFFLQIYALLGVKFLGLKMCQCKEMDKYLVWNRERGHGGGHILCAIF